MSQQRDEFGRFLPGHTGGPGRPKGKRNPAYMNIVEEVITPEDWRAIVERLKRHALHGELDVLKFLVPYLIGRPTLATTQQDEYENQDPNPLAPEPVEPPAQVSPSMLQELPQPMEQEKNECDEPIENTTNKRLVLRSVARRRP